MIVVYSRFASGLEKEFGIVFALHPLFNVLRTTNDGSYRLDLNAIVFSDGEHFFWHQRRFEIRGGSRISA